MKLISSSMKAVALAAIVAALAVPAVALAGTHRRVARNCHELNGNVAVLVTGHVNCTTARRVAKVWVNRDNHGRHGPFRTSGFRCRTVHGGASGDNGVCTKGSNKVQAIPE